MSLDSHLSPASENKQSIYQTTIDAILSPSRLSELTAADVDPILYDAYSFYSRIWSIHGRNLSMLMMPLLILLLWGLGWQLLFVYSYETGEIQAFIASIDQLVVPILTPLSFLLTFRLGRAAVRFWDGRTAVGKIIGICRSNISTVSVAVISPIRVRKQNYTWNIKHKTNQNNNSDQIDVSDDELSIFCENNQDEDIAVELLCSYARWLSVFPIAVNHHIRTATPKGWNENDIYKKHRYEIGTLISEDDAQKVVMPCDDESGNPTIDTSKGVRMRDPPLVVLNRLQQLAYDISYCTYVSADSRHVTPSAPNRAILYQQVINQLNELNLAYGAIERIKNTPLPFAYTIHLRTFLLLYLFLWNMTSVAEYGWVSLPFLFLLNWALLGIEAAAVECECPFQYRQNHLTLGKTAVLISKNIGQALRELAA